MSRIGAAVLALIALAVGRSLWKRRADRTAARLAARLGEAEPSPPADPDPSRPGRRWILYALAGGALGWLVFRALERRVVAIERRRPRRFGISHPDFRD